MRDIIEQYEEETRNILDTRKKRREEYSQLLENKRAEIEEITSLIDDALSEDNLEKVEQLTIRKTGLETFLRTLEERRGAQDSAAQKAEYQRKGSIVYHGLVNGLNEADSKDYEKALEHLRAAKELSQKGKNRKDRAQNVVNTWTSSISTIDGSSAVGITTKLADLDEQLNRLSIFR